MLETIRKELNALEGREEVRVLYACESGSRAWGFASRDSDYDVRFIYVRPTAWYLRVHGGRDVVERPVDGALDVSGWDLRKALALLAKSNPPLLEWLRSPIIYHEEGTAVERMRDFAAMHFSPPACLHHYLHMAEGNYREYLQGEKVRLKKYFYVLRPLLACRWIERTGTVAPMEFEELADSGLDAGEEDVRREIAALLARKLASEELDEGPRVEALNRFIGAEIARFREIADRVPRPPVPVEKLDLLFREILTETWGEGF